MRIEPTLFGLSLLALAGCENRAAAPTENTESAAAPIVEHARQPAAEVAKPAPPPLFNPFAQHDVAREGDVVPDPELFLPNGKMVLLTPFRGRSVVVFFYGKDDTADSTAEAGGFRDLWSDFEAAHVKVFGVSTDTADAHKQFTARQSLPFDLAVDANGAVAKTFGVASRNGEEAAVTYLIDPNGRIAKIWNNGAYAGHARDVLAAARAL